MLSLQATQEKGRRASSSISTRCSNTNLLLVYRKESMRLLSGLLEQIFYRHNELHLELQCQIEIRGSEYFCNRQVPSKRIETSDLLTYVFKMLLFHSTLEPHGAVSQICSVILGMSFN